MVNGPGTVILMARLVLARRNSTSRTSTGCLRSSEAIRVAFATLLPVRDDIEPGTLLVANSENRCIVLRFFEEFRIDAPQLPRSHAWWKAPGKLLAVDQPIWLRIGANE